MEHCLSVKKKMEAREDWARITRGIQEAFSGLIGAVGAVRVAREDRRTKPRSIRLISWAGRADTDAWILMQLEQGKNRALIYYTMNIISLTTKPYTRRHHRSQAISCARYGG